MVSKSGTINYLKKKQQNLSLLKKSKVQNYKALSTFWQCTHLTSDYQYKPKDTMKACVMLWTEETDHWILDESRMHNYSLGFWCKLDKSWSRGFGSKKTPEFSSETVTGHNEPRRYSRNLQRLPNPLRHNGEVNPSEQFIRRHSQNHWGCPQWVWEWH